MNWTRTLSRYARVCAYAAGLAIAANPLYAQEKVTIKMWNLVEEGYPAFLDYAKAEYAKTHPNVTIVNEFFPNEAYKTNLQVALVGSAPPDVFFNWSGEDAQRLIRDGLVLDITDLESAPGGFKSSISESWQAAFEKDGRNYGVPNEAVSKYFFYNKGFFETNKLTPPADFNGLLGLCKAIRTIDPSIVPLPLGNSERWKLIHYMTMLNDRVLGSATTSPDYALTADDATLFTNPGYVEAWQKVLDLKAAGCFQDAPNATSPEVSRSMFSSEVSPMIYCGTWCAGIFDAEGFTNYAMFRMPPVAGGKGDPNTNFLVPQGLMVSSKTQHAKEAVEWVSFLVSAPIAAKYAEIKKAIPSNPTDIDTVTNTTAQFKWIVKDVATFSAGINVLDVNLEQSVSEAYLNAGVEVLNGTLTPQQAMEKIRTAALAAKAKRAK
jgi:raffinose/stachyose/melibiose transport system substrate-binding protein